MPSKYYWSLLACSLLGGFSTQADAAAEDGYIFKQDSSRYGKLTCYVTPTRFRMDAMDLQIHLKPPYKFIIMYNTEQKLQYKTTVDSVAKRLTLRTVSEKDKKLGTVEVLRRIEDRKIAGFMCQGYRSEHIYKDKKKLPRPRMNIYATRELNLPKEMEMACAHLSDCPTGLGFPLRLQFFENYKDEKTGLSGIKLTQLLNTLKAEKAKLNDQIFQEPKGFKIARDEAEVVLGDTGY